MLDCSTSVLRRTQTFEGRHGEVSGILERQYFGGNGPFSTKATRVLRAVVCSMFHVFLHSAYRTSETQYTVHKRCYYRGVRGGTHIIELLCRRCLCFFSTNDLPPGIQEIQCRVGKSDSKLQFILCTSQAVNILSYLGMSASVWT